ncbi:hypothetical protein BDV11DRAFT_177630 [Aspergillus similis]
MANEGTIYSDVTGMPERGSNCEENLRRPSWVQNVSTDLAITQTKFLGLRRTLVSLLWLGSAARCTERAADILLQEKLSRKDLYAQVSGQTKIVCSGPVAHVRLRIAVFSSMYGVPAGSWILLPFIISAPVFSVHRSFKTPCLLLIPEM